MFCYVVCVLLIMLFAWLVLVCLWFACLFVFSWFALNSDTLDTLLWLACLLGALIETGCCFGLVILIPGCLLWLFEICVGCSYIVCGCFTSLFSCLSFVGLLFTCLNLVFWFYLTFGDFVWGLYVVVLLFCFCLTFTFVFTSWWFL